MIDRVPSDSLDKSRKHVPVEWRDQVPVHAPEPSARAKASGLDQQRSRGTGFDRPLQPGLSREQHLGDEHEPPVGLEILDPARSRPPRPPKGGQGGGDRCVASCVADIEQRGWAHHVQRLMALGNLALLAGVDPRQVTDRMRESFVDGAEWVMVPNAVGMALYADGGRMSTKPYAAGGANIDRMSDYCKGCAYDRKQRVGATACPFTTLYWDFLLRHTDRFARNLRIAVQLRAAQQLNDSDAVRERAREVLQLLDAGTL